MFKQLQVPSQMKCTIQTVTLPCPLWLGHTILANILPGWCVDEPELASMIDDRQEMDLAAVALRASL